MGSFKRAFLGYRCGDVDAAIAAHEARTWALERDAEEALQACREAWSSAVELEREVTSLSGMVIEREREIRSLGERLREANERHDRGIASLETAATRMEEIQAQARGQATRIRMKALRDAVEVSRRAQELAEVETPAESTDGAEPDLVELFEGLVKV